ncbi:MAG: sulfite exporter TauE/SafE family protein [Methanomicrobiales archaeon]
MSQIIFFLVAYIAEVIGTSAGFGSSTIFLPLALFFVDFPTALILVAIFHIFGNLGRITFFRKGIHKKLILIFGVPSIVLTVIGAYMVPFISQDILKLILGIFLIFFSILSIYKPDLRFPATKKSSIMGGSISGFLAGLIGTGGALRGAFLMAFNLQKATYIATAAVIALAVDITRIPIYLSEGFLNPDLYYYIPLLFIVSVAGSYTGKRIVNKIHQEKFKKFVLIVIILISMKLIFDGIIWLFSG